MAVEVKRWMAKDGTLFCDKRDAVKHEIYVERIEFIEKSLAVDFDKAVEIIEFIRKYAIVIRWPGMSVYEALVD